eukprot:5540820-Prymnesium_polylepis.1
MLGGSRGEARCPRNEQTSKRMARINIVKRFRRLGYDLSASGVGHAGLRTIHRTSEDEALCRQQRYRQP